MDVFPMMRRNFTKVNLKMFQIKKQSLQQTDHTSWLWSLMTSYPVLQL